MFREEVFFRMPNSFFQYFNAGGNLIKAILSLRVGFMGLLHFGGLVVVNWAAVVECSFR
jgi:hypothetical protein